MLDFIEAKDDGVQSSSQIITTNKPTSSFLQVRCPSYRSTNRVKALNGNCYCYCCWTKTNVVV